VRLNAQAGKLYHMGIRGRVRRSTLARANEVRDWRIYASFATALIAQARELYADDPLLPEFDGTAYALDTRTIDLALTLFPWAPFERSRGAVKLHTQIAARQYPSLHPPRSRPQLRHRHSRCAGP
jgi:hypothetical protein